MNILFKFLCGLSGHTLSRPRLIHGRLKEVCGVCGHESEGVVLSTPAPVAYSLTDFDDIHDHLMAVELHLHGGG